jgi:hypothetical protein
VPFADSRAAQQQPPRILELNLTRSESNAEHNFMVSPEGRVNFNNQLKQLIGSIQYSNDYDVHTALILAPSYAKTIDEKYYAQDKNVWQRCREYVDLFGIMQKNENALDILIEEAKATLRTWGSQAPTFMLTNSKLTMQMTMTPEQTSYFAHGIDGQRKLAQGPMLPSYRGLNIINSRSFSTEEGARPRDMLDRRVRVAEYYAVRKVPYKNGKLEYPNDYVELYDQSRDQMFRLTFQELHDHAELPGDENLSDFSGMDPQLKARCYDYNATTRCWSNPSRNKFHMGDSYDDGFDGNHSFESINMGVNNSTYGFENTHFDQVLNWDGNQEDSVPSTLGPNFASAELYKKFSETETDRDFAKFRDEVMQPDNTDKFTFEGDEGKTYTSGKLLINSKDMKLPALTDEEFEGRKLAISLEDELCTNPQANAFVKTMIQQDTLNKVWPYTTAIARKDSTGTGFFVPSNFVLWLKPSSGKEVSASGKEVSASDAQTSFVNSMNPKVFRDAAESNQQLATFLFKLIKIAYSVFNCGGDNKMTEEDLKKSHEFLRTTGLAVFREQGGNLNEYMEIYDLFESKFPQLKALYTTLTVDLTKIDNNTLTPELKTTIREIYQARQAWVLILLRYYYQSVEIYGNSGTTQTTIFPTGITVQGYFRNDIMDPVAREQLSSVGLSIPQLAEYLRQIYTYTPANGDAKEEEMVALLASTQYIAKCTNTEKEKAYLGLYDPAPDMKNMYNVIFEPAKYIDHLYLTTTGQWKRHNETFKSTNPSEPIRYSGTKLQFMNEWADILLMFAMTSMFKPRQSGIPEVPRPPQRNGTPPKQQQSTKRQPENSPQGNSQTSKPQKQNLQQPVDGTQSHRDFVIVRPCIEHQMLGVIMGRGGKDELGCTFWGQTELSVYDDSMHGHFPSNLSSCLFLLLRLLCGVISDKVLKRALCDLQENGECRTSITSARWCSTNATLSAVGTYVSTATTVEMTIVV